MVVFDQLGVFISRKVWRYQKGNRN